MDRESRLTGARVSAQSEVRTSSSYLGIAGLACATGLFFFRRRAAWQTSDATVFRLFVALTFLAHWLGLGVNTALSGQFAFLSHAGFCVGSGDSDFLGTARAAGSGDLGHHPRVSPGPPLAGCPRNSGVFLRSGFPIDRTGCRSTVTSVHRTIFLQWAAYFAFPSPQALQRTFSSAKCRGAALGWRQQRLCSGWLPRTLRAQ